MTTAPAAGEQARAQPFETFLPGLPAWQVAALKATTRWPGGYAVTQAEFDQALHSTLEEVIA